MGFIRHLLCGADGGRWLREMMLKDPRQKENHRALNLGVQVLPTRNCWRGGPRCPRGARGGAGLWNLGRDMSDNPPRKRCAVGTNAPTPKEPSHILPPA